MSKVSNWPLPPDGKRHFLPLELQNSLAHSALAKGLFPSAFGYYPEAHGHRMNREKHDDYLIIYCANGQGYVSTPELETTVVPGDLVILPKGTSHYYESGREKPWTIYWTHFEGELAPDFLQLLLARNTADQNPVATAIGQKPEYIQLFQQLMRTAEPSWSFAGALHACQLLKHFFTLANLNIETEHPANSSLDINRVHHYFSLHIDKKPGLEEIAQEFNMSRFHFNRVYKQLTGKTPVQYFTEQKIKHACELLDTTSWTIELIALKTGYNDPDYFSRVFRKTMGISPRQYRLSNMA